MAQERPAPPGRAAEALILAEINLLVPVVVAALLGMISQGRLERVVEVFAVLAIAGSNLLRLSRARHFRFAYGLLAFANLLAWWKFQAIAAFTALPVVKSLLTEI